MNTIPVEQQISEYIHTKASYLGIPVNGTFEITPVCNMNCRMCYVRMSAGEQSAIAPLKSADWWLKLAEEAKKAGMIYLLITGGEPFTHPEIRKILEGIATMGLIISINTNATMITDDIIRWLRLCSVTRLNVSLYGASDATYERLCGNPKGYTQVTSAILKLKEAGMQVKVNMSITPYNEPDLEAMISWCEEHELLYQATSYMFPPVRKGEDFIGKNDRFTTEDAAKCSLKIERLINEESRFYEKIGATASMKISDALNLSDPQEGTCITCRAGKCSFWVTWRGHMYPCGMISEKVTADTTQLGFDEAWKQLKKSCSEVRLPAHCSVCELKDLCKPCAAICYAESGRYDMVPEYRCEMTHHYLNLCRQMVDNR